MVSRAMFFYRKTINIFCDTSDKELATKYGKFMATCPGFVATYQGRIITSGLEVFIDDNTIYGESKAIEMAVCWAHVASSRNIVVPEGYSIFSDNSAAVAGVCNQLDEWFNKLNAQERLSVVQTGKRAPGITWEDNIYNSAYSIFISGLPIRVFYTPGHIAVWNRPFAYKNQQEKFLRINKLYHGDLSAETDINILHEMATYNNIVDLMTRNFLYINKTNMEYDINNSGELMGLGSSTRFSPVRWPFINAQVPNYEHRKAPVPLLISQTSL